MNNPFRQLSQWIEAEHQKGAPDARCAVLATSLRHDATPHARIVAIHEITDNALLFFTQRNSRKVKEIQDNPRGSLTFWFALQQREVMLEGDIEKLTTENNRAYWNNYSRLAQIRFYSYAPTSGMPIADKALLEAKKNQIENQYRDKKLPLHPDYCGFWLKPQRIVFYSYRSDELSDVLEYRLEQDQWIEQWLSP